MQAESRIAGEDDEERLSTVKSIIVSAADIFSKLISPEDGLDAVFNA